MVLAVYEDESSNVATNYILDEGYYVRFAYSKLTENIVWTLYETNPYDTEVKDWKLRENQ
jgi:hypothetical protein